MSRPAELPTVRPYRPIGVANGVAKHTRLKVRPAPRRHRGSCHRCEAGAPALAVDRDADPVDPFERRPSDTCRSPAPVCFRSVLVPRDPLDHRRPDGHFGEEAEARSTSACRLPSSITTRWRSELLGPCSVRRRARTPCTGARCCASSSTRPSCGWRQTPVAAGEQDGFRTKDVIALASEAREPASGAPSSESRTSLEISPERWGGLLGNHDEVRRRQRTPREKKQL